MPLSAGTRLGPYEILALIGAGGMGEVYKARDTRLDRIVAVKVSKDEFSERFAREARNVAALNHPNICALYDVGPNYLVMEFVEGETLSGPLPIDTCLHYARQIVEAIEAAHDKGIVHRDLKPANVKVTPEGTVKVLDFGLAKALDAEVSTAPGPDSPTLSMAMTRAGMILGTAAYMAPEQAKGKQADRRADIWAFGVVLFEMVTGKQAFTGETAAETLASVMMAQLPLEQLPDSTPAALRQVIGRCLERDVKRRLQAIGEARIMLENPESLAEVPTRAETHPARPWIPWVLAAVGIIAALALAYLHFKPSPPPIVTRFSVPFGEGQQLTTVAHMFVDISPDGSQTVYVANNRLYMRSMSDLMARAIPGTDFGTNVSNPVFSPDGKSLAFFVNGDRTLKKIAVSGGAAVTICQIAEIPSGVSWGPDGIVFAEPNKGVLRVNPNGGTPQLLVAAKDNEQIVGPQMLPGSKALLMTLAEGAAPNSAAWDKGRIVVQTLKSGERKILVDGGNDGRYLPTGHLVYAVRGVLYAQLFDASRQEITPGPVSIVEGVSRVISGSAQFAFSSSGSMIYVAGPVSGLGLGNNVLALFDRKGDSQPLSLPPAGYDYPRVSHDGKNLAFEIDEGKESSIWIYPLSGNVAARQLTLRGTGSNRYPVWSPDGEWVTFQSDREGDVAIWRQRADGGSPPERLTKPDKGESHIPDSWSPDGQTLSFTSGAKGSSTVWTFSLRDKKSTLFVDAPGGFGAWSSFSPDGRWIAYSSDNRVYVKAFPPTATKYPVPHVGNDHHTLWSPDEKELFYESGNRSLVTVAVLRQPVSSLSFGAPLETRTGFATHSAISPRSFDILPGGKQFIGTIPAGIAASATASAPPQIQVVLNWFEELKQRLPGR